MKRMSIASKLTRIVKTSTDENQKVTRDDETSVSTSKYFDKSYSIYVRPLASSNMHNSNVHNTSIPLRQHQLKRIIASKEVSRTKKVKTDTNVVVGENPFTPAMEIEIAKMDTDGFTAFVNYQTQRGERKTNLLTKNILKVFNDQPNNKSSVLPGVNSADLKCDLSRIQKEIHPAQRCSHRPTKEKSQAMYTLNRSQTI